MRIAAFTDTFPLLSETFIVRQVAGLRDLGHEVHVYAMQRPAARATKDEEPALSEAKGPTTKDSGSFVPDQLPPTTYIDIPPASGYWEMPAFPPWGRTWLPGTERPLWNFRRLIEALPALVRCLIFAPRLAIKALSRDEYGYRASSLSTIYRMWALLPGRGRYDLAHAHFGPVADNFRFVRDLWRVPLVVSFHGYDVGVWPREKGHDVYRRLFRTADIVTANSDYTRRRLEALGCRPGKIRQLHMGLDLAEFCFRERTPPQDGRVEILSVGRLVEKKGFEFAIRAMAQVREKHPRVHYSIVGDGPLRDHLHKVADDLQLQEHVTLHGAGSGEFVRQKLAEAHIFVAPSVTSANGDVEGQGLVLQEAQACGLPVLATDHNGFPEGMVPGRSGFLIPERNVEALAERLVYMLERPDEWSEWGRAGRKHVAEHYDIRTLSKQLDSIYWQAILRYKHRKRRR